MVDPHPPTLRAALRRDPRTLIWRALQRVRRAGRGEDPIFATVGRAGEGNSRSVKDKLENKAHAMVCAGQITLRQAQQQIASNWQALYKRVYGVAPRVAGTFWS